MLTEQSSTSRLSGQELASLMHAGMMYRDSHRFQEARDIFGQIRMLNPTEPNAEIGLGSTCFSEGLFAAAIEHYKRALSLSPRSAYAYALLGESQIFLGEHGAARISLRRARELDPKGPHGKLAHDLLRFLECLAASEPERQDWQK